MKNKTLSNLKFYVSFDVELKRDNNAVIRSHDYVCEHFEDVQDVMKTNQDIAYHGTFYVSYDYEMDQRGGVGRSHEQKVKNVAQAAAFCLDN